MRRAITCNIASPPYRERHVAQIALTTDDAIVPGTHGTWHPLCEIVADNSRLEIELFTNADTKVGLLDYREFQAALEEGSEKLVQLYPELLTR